MALLIVLLGIVAPPVVFWAGGNMVAARLEPMRARRVAHALLVAHAILLLLWLALAGATVLIVSVAVVLVGAAVVLRRPALAGSFLRGFGTFVAWPFLCLGLLFSGEDDLRVAAAIYALFMVLALLPVTAGALLRRSAGVVRTTKPPMHPPPASPPIRWSP